MRKTSTYKPRPVRLDAVQWVMSGFQKIADMPDANAILRIKNHGAMRSLVCGTGTRDDADILMAALNITEALANLRLGTDWQPEIKAAQDAMLTMCRRYLVNQRFTFTGPELTAVNLAMEIHDAQLDACTVQEMEQALDIVKRVIQLGKARAVEEMA